MVAWSRRAHSCEASRCMAGRLAAKGIAIKVATERSAKVDGSEEQQGTKQVSWYTHLYAGGQERLPEQTT